jgi:L-alanine-DL-glutamate epimerase-like enolase superfamily enzyme
MRITDVETILLRQRDALDPTIADGSQDALLVRVHTDEGIVGIGEVDSVPLVAKAAIDAPPSHKIANGLRALLIGEDPLDVEHLWQKMYAGTTYFGRRGVVIHAISGIEIALWDLAGRAAGQPICELLGGAKRRTIKAYASTLMPETPEEVRRVVTRWQEEGFGAVKLGWGPLGRERNLDVDLVSAARDAGGPGLDLMIDIGFGWGGLDDALDRARAIAESRPYWIEEPFPPDDYDSYAELVRAVDVPVAAGEEETTVADFARLIERGNVAVVQPDVTRAGGILECLRIAALARERGRRCVPHSWSTGIIKAATLQVLAVIDEAEYFEYAVQATELNQRLVRERFPILDGEVAIPTGPGLGIELDEEVIEACRVP